MLMARMIVPGADAPDELHLLSDIASKNYENMKREVDDRSSWQKRLS